ncbi:MAG TPA: tetratricopeptide repeat protein [Candidatus Acidoferrum sp.]|nr:tetratricopeptide repeat protein [Candidatus Acidoferrum sp.]
MSEHISRKELKHDRVRESIEHGAEAVLSHTRIASIVLLAGIVLLTGYYGWKIYNERQTAQAQAALDDAMKIFNAQLLLPGQPSIPGEISYVDAAQRSQDAEVRLSAVAAKYPSTPPGRLARYYSALCLMDMDKLNQASEELKKLQNDSDKEMAALANYQQALIAERTGKNEQAVPILRALSNSGSVLVPKPLVLLELAGILRQTNPKEAASIYEQIKKDYPNSNVADEADRGLSQLSPQS